MMIRTLSKLPMAIGTQSNLPIVIRTLSKLPMANCTLSKLPMVIRTVQAPDDDLHSVQAFSAAYWWKYFVNNEFIASRGVNILWNWSRHIELFREKGGSMGHSVEKY